LRRGRLQQPGLLRQFRCGRRARGVAKGRHRRRPGRRVPPYATRFPRRPWLRVPRVPRPQLRAEGRVEGLPTGGRTAHARTDVGTVVERAYLGAAAMSARTHATTPRG